MKLTVIILTFSFLQLSAKTYSQSQKLSLQLKNVSIVELFNTIEAKADVKFFYQDEQLADKKKVSVQVSDKSLNEVLSEVLDNTNLSYRIVNNHVIVFETNKPDNTKANMNAQQQKHTVKGKVVDVKGDPMPGVNVFEKSNSLNGVISGIDGDYGIEVSSQEAVLTFSFIGFEPQNINVAGRAAIDITLVEEATDLGEVVVVGYGTQKKVNLTGAVDVIASDMVENRAAPTVSQMLQGAAPGLTFSVGSYGFQPGAKMSIDIRGIGSLNGGDPYVVIDGIPGDMNNLNPEDIESFSILKDAAASAIYGARAPNGVIVITTKSGKKNTKMSASYTGSVSIHQPGRLPKMLDSSTYARVMNEAGVNRGGRVYQNEIVDRIAAYQNENWEYLKEGMPDDARFFETKPRSNGYWANYRESHANYDWFDEFYGKSVNQKHNFSLNGGTEKSTFYFSAGYLDQEGVLNYGTDAYQRVNIMGKFKTAISDWWDFSYQPRFMKGIREIPNMDNQGAYELIFHQIARTPPTQAKHDGYGNMMIQSKIPWVNDGGTDITETTENWHNFATEIRPAKGWKVNADFAYKSVDMFRSDREFLVYEHLVDQSTVVSGNTNPSNIQQRHVSNYYWTSNMYSSYDFNVADVHNISVLTGVQYEYSNGRSMTGRKNKMMVADVPSLQTAMGDPVLSESLNQWASSGYFGRITYNYNQKYLFEANARYDGSSKYREDKRWGFFPSFSAGWNVHRENFWGGIADYVNTFKLRASWGQLGDQTAAAYQDLELMRLKTGQLNWLWNHGNVRPVGYTATSNLISPDLTWETGETLNLGVNMAFFNNKLQLDFDWFEKNMTDMIRPIDSRPGVLGARAEPWYRLSNVYRALPNANNSTLRTRGFELGLRWKEALSNGIVYNLGATLYDAKSVITDYHNPSGTLRDYYEGKEYGEIWGWTSNDLFRTQTDVDNYLAKVDPSYIFSAWNTGDVKYEDLNKDNKLDIGEYTIDNHGDLSVIGNNQPRWQYTFNAGVSYKGLDFNMLWKGVAKRDIGLNNSQNMFWGFTSWNQSTLFPDHLDYFRDQPGDKYTGLKDGEANINTQSYWPRPYLHNKENGKNRRISTRYLQDASYLRLQTVQLGYSLPSQMISKINLSKVRVYVSAENLLTFTKLPDSIDPMALSSSRGYGKTYGADRIISFGLNLTY